jgi:hypothetical protein
MIISNLCGGLGNQMFQYACARSLALDLSLPLMFKIDTFKQFNSYHNGFELNDVFNLDLNIAQKKDLINLIGLTRIHPKIRNAISRKSFSWLANSKFLSEPHFHYWSELQQLAVNGAYLHGYWQSEKYFSHHSKQIRADFNYRSHLIGRNLAIANMILSGQSVSIHVRRGDYISNNKAKITHGTCSPEYYFKALEMIIEIYPDTKIFAFSDDPQWVSDILHDKYPDLILIDHNTGNDSYIDMLLMSLCNNHIIANSSFSWWGAWLNPNPDKLVIAPSCWFISDKITKDLIPEKWIKI